jgi:formylglycine-generating enzyme
MQLRWAVLATSSLLSFALACSGAAFSGAEDDPPAAGNAGSLGSVPETPSSGGAGASATAGATAAAGAPSTGVGGVLGTGGAESEAGAGGEGEVEVPVEGPRGPTLVRAGGFSIDSTEVTVEQYDAFLAARGGDVSGQAPECAWNDSFVPGGATRAAKQPVTSVDFCDAKAFCAWSGKRLCGKRGGGKLTLDQVPSASASEWFEACGGPKGQPYPYGSSHVGGKCNDASAGKNSVMPVGSFPGCTGVYPHVLDMVGNVAEWVDACDASNDGWDGCETIGGTFADNLSCSGSGLKHRDQKEPNVGFRCCAD